MSRKHKKVCTTLNYIENFLTLVSVVAGCILISGFSSLRGIPTGIMSYAIGLKISARTAGIRNYKSTIKKKNKIHAKIVLLVKAKLKKIEL